MKIITCIVVDDEPLAVQLMETYVRKTPYLELKNSFSSASTAFAYLQENPVDLVYCDIQMPNLNGMELSKMLPERTRIVFTTAFSNYAIEGFKVNALDYLLKPISYNDFLASAQRALDFFEMSEKASETPQAPPNKAQAEEIRSIFIKSEYKLQQIDLEKILYIEGLKDYVKIYQEGGEPPVLSLMRMKTLEEQLPAKRFVRVQKSFIVSIAKIDAIERNHIIIGKARIPIGDSYQDLLYTALSGSSLLPK